MGTFSSRNGDTKNIFFMLCLKELGSGEESYLIYFINMTVSLFHLPRPEFLDCDCYHCEKSIVFKVTIFRLATIGLHGFAMVFVLATIGLNGFSMVANHWSNDGMVTIHRYGLGSVGIVTHI